jgi:hypothetical protein
VPALATLVSTKGANGNNQDYKVLPDQIGQASFLLVNVDTPAETFPLTVTYQDGASEV